jgi:hypothetical protein
MGSDCHPYISTSVDFLSFESDTNCVAQLLK